MRALTKALCLCVGLMLPAARAQAGADAWGPQQLMAELAQREHAQASFVEAKYLRLLSRPLALSGTLSYTPPDRLEKRTLSPNEEILVVDGDRVSVEIKARRIKRTLSLQQHPVLWAFVESLRATLRGDLETLQRFYRIELAGDAAGWRLALTPSERRMSAVISEIRIGGGDGRVRSIEILETRGDRSVMRIREEAR
jgi:outer membrane lipoprotein-sorting protein